MRRRPPARKRASSGRGSSRRHALVAMLLCARPSYVASPCATGRSFYPPPSTRPRPMTVLRRLHLATVPEGHLPAAAAHPRPNPSDFCLVDVAAVQHPPAMCLLAMHLDYNLLRRHPRPGAHIPDVLSNTAQRPGAPNSKRGSELDTSAAPNAASCIVSWPGQIITHACPNHHLDRFLLVRRRSLCHPHRARRPT